MLSGAPLFKTDTVPVRQILMHAALDPIADLALLWRRTKGGGRTKVVHAGAGQDGSPRGGQEQGQEHKDDDGGAAEQRTTANGATHVASAQRDGTEAGPATTLDEGANEPGQGKDDHGDELLYHERSFKWQMGCHEDASL